MYVKAAGWPRRRFGRLGDFVKRILSQLCTAAGGSLPHLDSIQVPFVVGDGGSLAFGIQDLREEFIAVTALSEISGGFTTLVEIGNSTGATLRLLSR